MNGNQYNVVPLIHVQAISGKPACNNGIELEYNMPASDEGSVTISFQAEKMACKNGLVWNMFTFAAPRQAKNTIAGY